MKRQSFSVENGRWDQPVAGSTPTDPAWGDRFSHRSSVLIDLPHGNNAHLFLDNRLAGSSSETILECLRNEINIGYVIDCEGTQWSIVNEALSANEFGVTVFTQSGKAIIAGAGHVNPSGRWSARISTLYPRIRNSRHVTVYGSISGGSGQKTQVEGGIRAEW